MLVCIPFLIMFPVKRLHSWTSQKREFFHTIMSSAFQTVILPVLCWYLEGQIFWFLVAFSKLVAWLWDNGYELHWSLHFSEIVLLSSCRKVDSSFGYLIHVSTGFRFAVCILVSRKWKMLLLVWWLTDHQEHSAMAMEWNHC